MAEDLRFICNVGNACYNNVVFQLIYNIPELRNIFSVMSNKEIYGALTTKPYYFDLINDMFRKMDKFETIEEEKGELTKFWIEYTKNHPDDELFRYRDDSFTQSDAKDAINAFFLINYDKFNDLNSFFTKIDITIPQHEQSVINDSSISVSPTNKYIFFDITHALNESDRKFYINTEKGSNFSYIIETPDKKYYRLHSIIFSHNRNILDGHYSYAFIENQTIWKYINDLGISKQIEDVKANSINLFPVFVVYVEVKKIIIRSNIQGRLIIK